MPATAPPSAPFGATPTATQLLSSTEFWVVVVLLVVVLLAGALVLWFVDRWRKSQPSGDKESAESLTSFRAMYARGELSEEEYQKVRLRMAGQMKKPPPPVAPTAVESEPPPEPDKPPDPAP